jgi:branched-chain amino acid transport system permease protein
LDKFIALLASGVAQAAIYVLVGMGFLLIYKATGVFNFAQGDLATLGAYIAFVASTQWGLSIGLAYAAALGLSFIVGMAFERLAHNPLRGRNTQVHLIVTFGAGLAIRASVGIWQGSQPKRLRSPTDGHVLEIGGAVVAYQRIVIIAVATIAVIGVMLLFYRTSFGRQVRALAADREVAQLQGIAVGRVAIITFGLSTLLAGLAGILLGPLTAVDQSLGFVPMLGAFAAAVVGGFGRLGGLIIGALIIGLAEQLVGGYFFTDYREAYPYIVMLLIIAFRPEGLLRGEVGVRV